MRSTEMRATRDGSPHVDAACRRTHAHDPLARHSRETRTEIMVNGYMATCLLFRSHMRPRAHIATDLWVVMCGSIFSLFACRLFWDRKRKS